MHTAMLRAGSGNAGARHGQGLGIAVRAGAVFAGCHCRRFHSPRPLHLWDLMRV